MAEEKYFTFLTNPLSHPA